MNQFGLTAQGLKTPRLLDLKNIIDQAFIAEFGDINLDPQSVAGQLSGIFSKLLADDSENIEDVYFSAYPNSATGISLDNVVALNGIVRLPALQTSVIGVLTGLENTVIPQNSLARIPETQEVFFSNESAVISRTRSVKNIISVLDRQPVEYTVFINNVPYTLSAPILTFDSDFVSGNIISIRLNGVNLPSVAWAGSQNATLDAISAILLTNPAVQNAIVVYGTREIFVTPNLGFQTVFNSVGISGGASQPVVTIPFNSWPSLASIAQYLSALIDNSSLVTSSYSVGQAFDIQSRDGETPYSINVSPYLSIASVSSPIEFKSINYGPIAAPVGSLIEIMTPVSGWTNITNFKAGVTGRNQETDSELRLRRELSIRIAGTATVEAIRARLLQEVPGVSSVTIIENITISQGLITIVFSSDFVSGNNIVATIDGQTQTSIPFTLDHITTITLLADQIRSFHEVESVEIVGINNRTLEIQADEGQTISIGFSISGGVSQPSYVLTGGMPPKSFESIVEGGSDQAVALKIWQTKPAGIETFGNQTVIIVDSQGNNQAILFTRGTPVYIWAQVVLSLNPQETFPVNGQQLVAQTIMNYGNSLGVGIDVLIQRVLAQIVQIEGVSAASLQLARTSSTGSIPSYAAADIDIASSEVSVWDLSRIFVSI